MDTKSRAHSAGLDSIREDLCPSVAMIESDSKEFDPWIFTDETRIWVNPSFGSDKSVSDGHRIPRLRSGLQIQRHACDRYCNSSIREDLCSSAAMIDFDNYRF